MTPISITRPILWALVASALCVFNAVPHAIAEEPVSFRNQIAPILVQSCLGCHKTGKAQSGFNLETVALLKRGGVQVQEETLVPGRPDESYLVEVIRPDAQPRMPYKLPPLSNAEIALIETWVAQGAAFDVPSEEETRLVTLVDPLTVLPAVAPEVPPREPVGAVAFAPDGQTVIAAFGDRLKRFDAARGTLQGQPLELPGRIAALGFTPEARVLWVAGGRPGQHGFVALVDPTTWTLRAQAQGHTDAILDAAATPDGRRLVTVSYDQLGLIWSLTDDQNEPTSPAILLTLKEHTDAVHAVAVSPDGRLIATGSADRSVKVWDAATGTRLVTLSEATGPQLAVAFGPEPDRLTAAGADRALRVWTLRPNLERQPPTATAELLQTRLAHRAPVQRLLRWNDQLASVGADRALKLWTLDRDGWQPDASHANQSDWPRALAIAPDHARLALGRLDGTLDLFDSTTATILLTLTPQPPTTSPDATATAKPAQTQAKAKPVLFRAATLNPPNPRGVIRGRTTRLNLTGTNLQHATTALVPEGWSFTLVPLDPPKPNALALDLNPPANAPLEPIALRMVTPYGITNGQLVDVLNGPEFNVTEPNDPSQPLIAPVLSETDDLVIVGAIDKPGDVDAIQFDLPPGRIVRLMVAAESFGSPLRAEVILRNPTNSTILRRVRHADFAADPSLDLSAPQHQGPVVVELRDQTQNGSNNHLYRLRVGSFAKIDRLERLSVSLGAETTLPLMGANLSETTARVNAVSTPAGTLLTLPAHSAKALRAGTPRKVVVAEGPQFVVDSASDTNPNQPDGSNAERALAIPSGVTARFDQPGAFRDHWFRAVTGKPVVVEVFARRLGLALDSSLEILDDQGKSLTRAVLRPVAETQVTFRDHDASKPGIRLSRWDHLRMGDLLLAGRELMRIRELPRNPDDDCQFEAFDGRRLGFLESTPEHHPIDQLMRKVEFHPPGTVFPDQSGAPLALTFSNDDGGPGFETDSRVTFLPPRDGVYRARVSDARGFGPESEADAAANDDFAYHLVVRAPAPGFLPRLSPTEPIIPAGGATLATITLERRDGFTGAVRIEPVTTPPGLTITPTIVEADRPEAEVLIAADADASSFFTDGLELKAVALDHADDPAWQRTIKSGSITVARMNDLTIEPISTDPITLKPGGVTTFAFRVNRLNPEIGRIPVEFKNLPYGVRVLNIGLNGILVTPQETERVVELYAEPWVRPMRRPIYPTARVEATRQVFPVAAPVELIIADQPAVAAESSSDEASR